jgi:hypothetical protein
MFKVTVHPLRQIGDPVNNAPAHPQPGRAHALRCPSVPGAGRDVDLVPHRQELQDVFQIHIFEVRRKNGGLFGSCHEISSVRRFQCRALLAFIGNEYT